MLLLASHASAALLEITVTGTIAGGSDSDGSVFGLGAGANPAGQTIRIVFTIDTTRAPSDIAPGSDVGNYVTELFSGAVDASKNFIQTTWVVNGISRSSFLPTLEQRDAVTLFDDVQGGTDSIGLRDFSTDGPSISQIDRSFQVALLPIFSSADILDGDALQQSPGNLSATSGVLSCGQCIGSWVDNTGGKHESAAWSLDPNSLTLSYRVLPAPEPNLAALLGAAAVALAARRTRR
jgi:hypothetical protein